MLTVKYLVTQKTNRLPRFNSVPLSLTFKICLLFCLMCMGDLPGSMSVCHVCAVPADARRGTSDCLELVRIMCLSAWDAGLPKERSVFNC